MEFYAYKLTAKEKIERERNLKKDLERMKAAEKSADRSRRQNERVLKSLDEMIVKLDDLKADTSEYHSGGMYKEYSTNPEIKQRGRDGRFNWKPYQSIPNCAEFTIKPRGQNSVLSLFGLVKNNEPEIKIKKWKNRKLQKYASYQIKRLRSNTDNPSKY